MKIKEEEHEYRRPDDIHPIRANKQAVKHQIGGDEKWYQ